MYTTCRIYTNATELADLIIANRGEIETLLRSCEGFQAYYMVKTSDGVMTITVCDSQVGTDQSTQKAADWVKSKGAGLTGTKPEIHSGPAAIAFTSGRAAVTV